MGALRTRVWPGAQSPTGSPAATWQPALLWALAAPSGPSPCPARRAWQQPCAPCAVRDAPASPTRCGGPGRLLCWGAQQEGSPLTQWPSGPRGSPWRAPPCSALLRPNTPSRHATLALDSSHSNRQRDGLGGAQRSSGDPRMADATLQRWDPGTVSGPRGTSAVKSENGPREASRPRQSGASKQDAEAHGQLQGWAGRGPSP